MITEDLEDVVTYEEYGFSISQPNLNTKASRDESPNQSTTNTTFIPTIQSNVIQQKQQHKSIFTYRKKFQPELEEEVGTSDRLQQALFDLSSHDFDVDRVMNTTNDATSALPTMNEPDYSDACAGQVEPMHMSAISSPTIKSVSPKKLIAPSAYQYPLPAKPSQALPQKKVKLEKTNVSDILGRPAHWGVASNSSSSSSFNRIKPIRPSGPVQAPSLGRIDGKLPLRPKVPMSQSQRGFNTAGATDPGKISFQPSWLRTTSSLPPKALQQSQQEWPKSMVSYNNVDAIQDQPDEVPAGYSPSAYVPNQPTASRQSIGTSGGITSVLKFSGRQKGGVKDDVNTHSSPVQHSRGPARAGTLKHLLLKCSRSADSDEMKLIELPFTERVSSYQTGERMTTERSATKDPLDPRNRASEKIELQIMFEVPSSATTRATVNPDGTQRQDSVVQWPSYGPFRVFVALVSSIEGESGKSKTARVLFSNTTTEPSVEPAMSEEQAADLTIRSTVLFIVKSDSCVDDSRRLDPGSSVRVFDTMQVRLNPFLCALVNQLRQVNLTLPSSEIVTGVISDTASLSSTSQVPSLDDIKSALICTQLWEPVEA